MNPSFQQFNSYVSISTLPKNNESSKQKNLHPNEMIENCYGLTSNQPINVELDQYSFRTTVKTFLKYILKINFRSNIFNGAHNN